MKSSARFALFLAALWLIAPLAKAQGDSDDTGVVPITLGDFTLSGSSTVGFRFTDVKGYEPQYREMFDLNNGFRLLDLNVEGEAQDGKNAFADGFSLQVGSLGGDPFPTAQFAISKNKVYDFRVDWRQDYYFWNQNDNVILPIAKVAGLSTGLTSNHDWATVRKFGSVDFTLHATNNLRFRFNYYRPSDEGMTYTTRSPDFFDSLSYWGTYARGNAYYLFAPLNDYTDRFTGGVDYSYKDWSFHYNIGYQTFTENINLSNVSSPELSIDPAASSLTEPIANLSGAQFRKLTTPISEFTFVGKPLKKLEWCGGYTYYRYQGPATFVQEYNGIAPNATNVLAPYSVSESARATVIEPNNILTQGLTYHALHWLSFTADYKYSRFTSNSTGIYQSLLNGTTSGAGTTNTQWRNGLSDFTFSIDFMPTRAWIIRPGIQLLKSDVEAFTNGVVDPEITLRTNTASIWTTRAIFPQRIFRTTLCHAITPASPATPITQCLGTTRRSGAVCITCGCNTLAKSRSRKTSNSTHLSIIANASTVMPARGPMKRLHRITRRPTCWRWRHRTSSHACPAIATTLFTK